MTPTSELTPNEPSWIAQARIEVSKNRVNRSDMERRLIRTAEQKLVMLLGEDCSPTVQRVVRGEKREWDLGYATGRVLIEVDGEHFEVDVELRNIGHENYIHVTIRLRGKSVYSLGQIGEALGFR